MRRALVVAAVLGALGYAGVRLVDRVTLNHYGDPATPDGYLKHYVDDHLRLTVDRQQVGGQPSGRVVLRGRVRNGGDRPLRDVVVAVRYGSDPAGPWAETAIHLGRFAPGEERTLDQPVGAISPPPNAPSGRLDLYSEVDIEEVELAPTPGSTVPRP